MRLVRVRVYGDDCWRCGSIAEGGEIYEAVEVVAAVGVDGDIGRWACEVWLEGLRGGDVENGEVSWDGVQEGCEPDLIGTGDPDAAFEGEGVRA